MDIQNVAQRGEASAPARQPTGGQAPESGAEFAGALDDQGGDDGGSQQAAASVETEPELSEQEKLRQERLERFGSYTAYSLWRKTPAMALGIVTPKSEEVFAEHGLLDYWHTEKAHWQGQVAAMTEEEREATGTSLLDEEQAVAAVSQDVEAADAIEESQAAEPPVEAPEQVSQEMVQTASHEVSTAPVVSAEPVVTPPSEPEDAAADPEMTTAAEDETPPAQPDEEPAADQQVQEANAVDEPEQAVPVVAAAQPVEAAKTQAELRQERLERFGSYTAYSLWRKVPAMALGIVEPKSEDYFAEHGLLDYWHTERDHWQGKVAQMSEAERAATGTTLLETTPVQAAAEEAVVSEVAESRETPPQADPSPNPAPEPVFEEPVVGDDPIGPVKTETSAQPAAASIVQEIEEAKTQEELRQERLERFGSYTAYSLWRKVPAMALGIVQPKSEDYFAEHGLLEYWRTEREHWQGQVAAMTEAERIATGTSLLDES